MPLRTLLGCLSLAALLAGCAADGAGTVDAATDATDAATPSPPTTEGPVEEPQAATTGTATVTDCSPTAQALHPDVVDVSAEPAGDGAWRFAATLCSAYDTPDRYADAWRVRTLDGEVLGVRELGHDHAGEQPFTRSLASPVEIPADVAVVVVEGRDQANGWGGATLEVRLDG